MTIRVSSTGSTILDLLVESASTIVVVRISTLITISIPIAISTLAVGTLAGAMSNPDVKAGLVIRARFEVVCVVRSRLMLEVCSDWEAGEVAVILVLSDRDSEARKISELPLVLVGLALSDRDEDTQAKQ